MGQRERDIRAWVPCQGSTEGMWHLAGLDSIGDILGQVPLVLGATPCTEGWSAASLALPRHTHTTTCDNQKCPKRRYVI